MGRWPFQFAFWAAAAFAFYMATQPNPPALPVETQDKVQHILAFSVLALLGVLAFPRLRGWWLGIGLAVFGALIEFVQAIPALHRDASVFDWIADVGAILVVLCLALLVRHLLRSARRG